CVLQYWHKGCFSCEVCKMTLNMKNYKGFEKKPYCSQHYPKTGFTSVADTPENLRLAQQSKMQSQVLYKEEFEKNKGKGFSVVADTPELQRIKKSQDQISNVRCQTGKELFFTLDAREKIFTQSKTIAYDLKLEDMLTHVSLRFRLLPPLPVPSSTSYPSHLPQNYNYEPQPARSAAAPPPPSGGKRYRAIYDYAAADEDEVSFADGDVIMDVQQIDEGWMFGRVERTGQQGMLPANYVEAI
ncbi:LIM and SH3 domain protein 1, partial [Silurus meridionalis]